MEKALVTCHMGRHHRKFGHYDIETLLELGYEVHFAANFELEIDKVNDERIKLHQVDFSRNPFSPRNINAYFQIKKILKKYDFKLIHCQSPVGGVISRLASRKTRKSGTKIIYTAHGFHFYTGAPIINWLLYYPVEWFLSKHTDTLITINNEDYQLAKKKFSKRCKNIEYVPGVGIDTKRFIFALSEKEKTELRKSLGLKKDDFVMIYPARLDKNKNQIFLINCMEELVKEHNNIHLLLPGTDDLNGYYQKQVKNKKLEHNIHFLGFRDDIPRLMKISNLAVSSSLREGLPVNVIEAMYCDLLVIALECRGMTDLLGKESIFIINTKNEFINQILKVYNKTINPDVVIQINSKNLMKFSVENVKSKMIKIFK